MPAPAKPPVAALTARETEVLALVRERLTNAEIADRLFVSVRTVETHVSALLRKLGASDRRALARHWVPDPSTAERRGALPTPLTTFVGRTVERAELVAAFRDHRLVTATGPGGVGKTRLALAAAADVAGDFADGVVFVDLVKVTQPDAVGDAIAAAADVPETSTTTREEALVGALGRRDCLLVIDNCEHVQDAARTWIERLLHDCPSLRVLATSRLRLMLPFEHVVSVAGLSLGTPEDASDAEALFVERMTAAGAAPPQPAELAAIAEICSALDGMALGIELAAARAPSLGVTVLAGALGSRLDLLDVGPRAQERHRSLRAAIDWSYALLDADQRAVLRAASLFAAPPDLDAVSAVSGRPPGAAVAALGGLVDWNLVALLPGSPARYRVLETIRQYAADAAELEGETEELHEAHVLWCQRHLDDLSRGAPGDEQWCAEVDAVLDDARAALAWVRHRPGPRDRAVAIAGVAADVLFQRGHPGEAQRRYQDAALLADDPADRCRWLRLAAGAAAARNVGGDTVDLLVESARIALAAGQPDDAAHDLAGAAALQFRASGVIKRAIDVVAVERQLDEARALSTGAAPAEAAIAVAAGWTPGAHARSRRHTERARRLAAEAGDALLGDEVFDQMTALALDGGDLDGAAALAAARLDALTDVPVAADSGFAHYDALHMACHLKLAVGQLADARRYARAIAALPYFREQRHIGLGRVLEVEAIAGEFDAVVESATLFERDWDRAGQPVAGNLAVGAYAAATVFGMIGDPAARDRWISITQGLIPTPERYEGVHVTWRVTLDALLALHLDDPERACALLEAAPAPDIFSSDPTSPLWAPWYAAAWTEASVLAGRPDAGARFERALPYIRGNGIAVAIVDRAAAVQDGRLDRLGGIADRFGSAGCRYQQERTATLARHMKDRRRSR